MKVNAYEFYKNIRNILRENNFMIGGYKEENGFLKFPVYFNQKPYELRIHRTEAPPRLDLSQIKDESLQEFLRSVINSQLVLENVNQNYINRTLILEDDSQKAALKAILKRYGAEKVRHRSPTQARWTYNDLNLRLHESGKLRINGRLCEKGERLVQDIGKAVTYPEVQEGDTLGAIIETALGRDS